MARARLISSQVVLSESVSALVSTHGEFGALVWTWLIVHLDDFGVAAASPARLKGLVMPLSPRPPQEFAEVVAELQRLGMVTLYEAEGRPYLKALNFNRYQTGLRQDRLRKEGSRFPMEGRDLSGDEYLDLIARPPAMPGNARKKTDGAGQCREVAAEEKVIGREGNRKVIGREDQNPSDSGADAPDDAPRSKRTGRKLTEGQIAVKRVEEAWREFDTRNVPEPSLIARWITEFGLEIVVASIQDLGFSNGLKEKGGKYLMAMMKGRRDDEKPGKAGKPKPLPPVRTESQEYLETLRAKADEEDAKNAAFYAEHVDAVERWLADNPEPKLGPNASSNAMEMASERGRLFKETFGLRLTDWQSCVNAAQAARTLREAS